MPINLRLAMGFPAGRRHALGPIVLFAAVLSGCTTPPASPTLSAPSSPSPSATSPAVVPTEVSSSPSPAPVSGPGRIVFTEHQGSGRGFTVYTMNPDGSGRKALISGPNAIPRWSPDGRRIAVTLSVADPVHFETVMNADGSDVHDLARPDPSLSLVCTAWSPDNALLACEGWDPSKPGREGVYTVRASDGGGLKRITISTGGIHDIPGDFSPDGTQIVFVRATYPPTAVGQLWMANVDGSNPRKIADTLTGYRVSWSRDGRWVAGSANGQLLIFDLQNPSSTPRPIAIPKGIGLNPRWSPDGRALVFGFVRTGGNTREVYVVNADGTHPVGLTDEAHLDEYPDWGPST